MNTNFVIMGLPASGKTTFLAALWHQVEANEMECQLKLDGCSGDFTYLNLIAESWRTFKPVPRTSQVGDKDITIQLINPQTNVSVRVFFPDLAGETFDRQVEDRVCKPEFIDELSHNSGILFFINADVKEDSLSINELNARLPAETKEPDATVADRGIVGAPPVELREWEPKALPAQVKIVQLLSDLIRPPFEPHHRRLAVLISAWDLVRDMGLLPTQWLAVHMPLVDQFLRSNQEYFEHHVYGVSAQGVSLEDDCAIDQAAMLIPSRRIQIVGQEEEEERHDLTEPLVWLMSVNE